jgi:replicative DNA helicase
MTESKLFSDESERATLSILLQHPEKFYDSLVIKPQMFSSVPHITIIRAMLGIVEDGLSPEPTLLIEYLRVAGKLDEAGGEDYIRFLEKQKYNPENLPRFEKNVIDSFRGRSLLNLMNKIPGLVKATKDIGSVITFLKDSLTDLLVVSGGETVRRIKSVMEKHWNLLMKRRENPGVQGNSTGFRQLDWSTNGVIGGDFVVIAGRPSQGKTAWMCCSALNAETPCLIFSAEMNESILADRFISITSQVPLTNIRKGFLNQEQMDKVNLAVEKIKDKDIYIDATFSADIEYIINTIRQYHQLHGIESVYIDYVQLLAERGDGSTHEIGRISRRLKLIANELNIVVYLLSQLNRQVEMRDDKRPVLSDLRQSGNLEEDPDIVIFLYRDEYYNHATEHKGVMENIIRKNRNGPIGTLSMTFIPETATVLDRERNIPEVRNERGTKVLQRSSVPTN